MISLPYVLQSCFNQVRAIVPSIPEHTSPPCVLSTQPACLALAMTLFTLPEKAAAGANSGRETTGSNEHTHLILTPTQEEAEELYEDLKFFFSFMGRDKETLALFPPWATIPYNPALPPHSVICQRVRSLHRLSQGKPTVVVSSLPAVLHKLLPPDVFSRARFSLQVGRTCEREVLLRSLIRLGYT